MNKNTEKTPYSAKDILDRYPTQVLDKSAIFFDENTKRDIPDSSKRFMYRPDKYSEGLVLWKAPDTWLRVEFDCDDYELVKDIISYAISRLSDMGISYCISDHGGRSPYMNIVFDGRILTGAKNVKFAKLAFCQKILNDDGMKYLDKTNLSWTWSPIIGHEHWKKKYGGRKHVIISGTHPLEQKNTFPDKIITSANKAFDTIRKSAAKATKSAPWVKSFLFDYCTTHELPHGQRHIIISKNFAAATLTIESEDERMQLMQAYEAAQKGSMSDIMGWYLRAISGDFDDVNTTELKKYIQDNNIPFDFNVQGQEAPEQFNLDQRWNQPDILNTIVGQQDKYVFGQRKERTALTLTLVTSLNKDDALRQSASLRGGSSAGKTLIVKTCALAFPPDKYFDATRVTANELELQISNDSFWFAIVGELNEQREDGNNRNIVEQLKQISDGGLCVYTKDSEGNSIKISSPQKPVITTTTQIGEDDEQATRRINISVLNDADSNVKTVGFIFDKYSEKDGFYNQQADFKWIQDGMTIIKKSGFEFIMPFNNVFRSKEHVERLFSDLKQDRVRRDTKRLIAYAHASAMLHHKQRDIVEKNGSKSIIVDVCDFELAYKILRPYLADSYDHLEPRSKQILDKIEGDTENKLKVSYAEGLWVSRRKLQDAFGVSPNTIKAYLKPLIQNGFIVSTYVKDGNKGHLLRLTTADEREAGGVKKGIKGVSKGVNGSIIDTPSHPFDTPNDTLRSAMIDEMIKYYSQNMGKEYLPRQVKLDFSTTTENDAEEKNGQGGVDFDTPEIDTPRGIKNAADGSHPNTENNKRHLMEYCCAGRSRQEIISKARSLNLNIDIDLNLRMGILRESKPDFIVLQGSDMLMTAPLDMSGRLEIDAI